MIDLAIFRYYRVSYHLKYKEWLCKDLQQPRLAQERLRVWLFSFRGKSATLEVIEAERRTS